MLKLTKTLAEYAGSISIICIIGGLIVLLTGNVGGLVAMAIGFVSIIAAGSVLLLASIDSKLDAIVRNQQISNGTQYLIPPTTQNQ